MCPGNIRGFVAELKGYYPEAQEAAEGNRRLVRLPQVQFPAGCKPADAPALVVFDPTQPKPQLLLQQVPALPNGKQPKSVNSVTVAGEAWFAYSFNLQWDENSHSIFQFVEGMLRRFAREE